MSDSDCTQQLRERILDARGANTPLVIHGGGSKAFYGGARDGVALDTRAHSGIIDYEPKELVLTVRAGTSLTEIEAALDAQHQLFAFEPPHYTIGATIGGVVASGLSGPRRASAGAVRDFVLGTRIIDGKGDVLQFGGRVIKNVAGYDVSRLMTGAMGTLGVLLDVSFKVLPKPASQVTLRFAFDEATAILRFNQWAGQPLPLSATAWGDGVAHVRLSGTIAGVRAATQKLGGEVVEGDEFWRSLRDHRHDFFVTDAPLWRLSVPATTPPIGLPTPQFIEWGGALRWLCGTPDAATLRATMDASGGHATLFRGGDKSVGVFHPLDPVVAKIHRNLKNAFDPHNILNRGRMDNF